MIFCLADKKDALQIAQIHKNEIDKGFLSSLDIIFLGNFYGALIESKFSFCIVAKEDDRIVGFISGVFDLDKFYRYFLKNYFFQSVVLLCKKVFNISYIKKILETLLYPVKEKNLPPAELLTMAVLKQFQGQGIAGKMFFEFLGEMKKRDIKTFKVLVGEELKSAIAFYEKNGFTFLKNTTIHNRKSSRIYLYDIK
ncbi:MAG: hypothetical protein A2908_03320 [Candidatus Staskawiczbacteria bacterium RIFCSPLOWO2_01_FULL_38_12b]|uniref:N-acetyltransferase domain-containing protein n=1 Tax=Candidatus Staskawiczbacteria bacterium RIFCSPLOWO2_01_FULL_38_12b TaxID=1802214 RepID=A0A1G2IFA3_9BACT|nr:MAG: hypothetical protein A2908_03320 [Candidatus Staskawiczbacteria bacterium RIFCSPLOWO2_01_FULL_38_12b]